MDKQGWKSVKRAQRLIDRERTEREIGVTVGQGGRGICMFPSPQVINTILKPNLTIDILPLQSIPDRVLRGSFQRLETISRNIPPKPGKGLGTQNKGN